MPFPANAIKGKANIQRKREKLAREAKEGFSQLPDWMFWEKEQMDEHIDEKTQEHPKINALLKDVGDFIRLVIRSSGHYEERD